MRKFRVWLDKNIVGCDVVEEIVEVEDNEDPDEICASALDTLISNEMYTGWDEVKE